VWTSNWGGLAEEVIAAVNRVLGKSGYEDPFDMTQEERREALKNVNPSNYGIYDAEVKLFLGYFEDMERVKELGGLHVIGSERHEARRIDNQLRGRAARQGDPGSSRFYLSLQDDLMRLQGGSQVSNLMERLHVDDSLPLEVRLVGNIIEQSQHRIEGANFDVRKHLLEYDDVLNKQRAQIYSQRDRIFVKEDLKDDIAEMLDLEVRQRVATGLTDEEGPWKLIAWLEQVQPPFMSGERLFPVLACLSSKELNLESDGSLALRLPSGQN
jgi:preprotein translocase subunit SecA